MSDDDKLLEELMELAEIVTEEFIHETYDAYDGDNYIEEDGEFYAVRTGCGCYLERNDFCDKCRHYFDGAYHGSCPGGVLGACAVCLCGGEEPLDDEDLQQ